MQALYATISKVAQVNCNVLLEAETGTGKQLTAQAIHDLGPERIPPLFTLTVVALPRNLSALNSLDIRRDLLPEQIPVKTEATKRMPEDLPPRLRKVNQWDDYRDELVPIKEMEKHHQSVDQIIAKGNVKDVVGKSGPTFRFRELSFQT